MNILVVGDVHGCYNTFSQLVEHHWDPDREYLIQVGDFISKGPHSAKTYEYIRKLKKEYPYQCYFIKGNHEHRFVQNHAFPGKDNTVDKTKRDFIKREINVKKAADWMRNRPLKWENPYILITHAGVSKAVRNPYVENNLRGVLHNRSEIRNVGKIQIFGHNVQDDGQPIFSPEAKAWCIDTAAWLGKNLTAVRFSYRGEHIETIQLPTHRSDLKKKTSLRIRLGGL